MNLARIARERDPAIYFARTGIGRLLQENGSHADDWIFGDGFEAAP